MKKVDFCQSRPLDEATEYKLIWTAKHNYTVADPIRWFINNITSKSKTLLI